jgi:signal transduction histidine kinase
MSSGRWVKLLRKYWMEIAWAVFSAINVLVILIWGQWDTVPFHFIWVSLTLVYGVRVWRSRSTWAVLSVVSAVTGAALVWSVIRTHQRPDEVSEVPLMAAMFVAMVWHAEREKAAMRKVRQHAKNEHRLLEHERDFVRDASHELRTPITVALGHAELLHSTVADPLVANDERVIADELQRLGRIAERLLLLGSAEHPDFLRSTMVELEPLVARALRRWSPNPRRWGLGPLEELAVHADADRLTLALDCLIENAVKHTRPEDPIELSVRRDGTSAVLRVADSGEGIPPEHLQRIFDRFARVDSARARDSGGVGLGLAIVKTVAEAHGGSVRVESSPGHGSTFELRLRLAPVSAGLEPEKSAPAPGHAGSIDTPQP